MILRQNTENLEGKSYLTENRLSKNEIWYAADNHNDSVTHVQKDFKIRTLIKQLSNFYGIALNFIFTKIVII